MNTMNMHRIVSDLDPDAEDEVVDTNDGGWDAIYVAIHLWRLCGSKRADVLSQLLAEIEEPISTGDRVMFPEKIRGVLDAFEGIEQAALALHDESGSLPPALVAAAEKMVPPVAEYVTDTDGTTGYKITNALLRVISLRAFLQNALREGGLVVLA